MPPSQREQYDPEGLRILSFPFQGLLCPPQPSMPLLCPRLTGPWNLLDPSTPPTPPTGAPTPLCASCYLHRWGHNPLQPEWGEAGVGTQIAYLPSYTPPLLSIRYTLSAICDR
jgi:hypothetical protein